MTPRPATGRAGTPGFLSKLYSHIPIAYLLVRVTTSAGAVAGGLIQTFVFARVLGTQDFAVFILLSSFGVAMNALDFGISKLLFVRLRNAFLKRKLAARLSRQATSVVAAYAGVVLVCVVLCGLTVTALPSLSAWQATQYELYFLFAALNLVWLPLRNISLAVDQFVFFEYLEAARRIGNAALTLALLIGFPMLWFLVAINLLWAILLWLSISRLIRSGAMTFGAWRFMPDATNFFHENRRSLAGSSIYGTAEIYIYAFPYAVVSAFFGLGSATIVLDTVLKVQRGAQLLYAAGCDVAVPSQTRAFASSNRAALLRGFWLAVVICAIPAAALCMALTFYSAEIFSTLLGSAAVMPDAAVNILMLMLIAGAIQAVSHSLLLHTGFFKEAARLGLGVAAALTVITVIALALRADLIGFMSIYAGIIAAGAFFAMVYASSKLFRPLARGSYRTAEPDVPARPALRRSRPASKGSR